MKYESENVNLSLSSSTNYLKPIGASVSSVISHEFRNYLLFIHSFTRSFMHSSNMCLLSDTDSIGTEKEHNAAVKVAADLLSAILTFSCSAVCGRD